MTNRVCTRECPGTLRKKGVQLHSELPLTLDTVIVDGKLTQATLQQPQRQSSYIHSVRTPLYYTDFSTLDFLHSQQDAARIPTYRYSSEEKLSTTFPLPPNKSHKRFLVGCIPPFMRLAGHLTFRFALGASNVCLVGENPTCSVPAL